MQYFGLRVIIKRIKAIKFMMADRSVPKRKNSSHRVRYHLSVPTAY